MLDKPRARMQGTGDSATVLTELHLYLDLVPTELDYICAKAI